MTTVFIGRELSYSATLRGPDMHNWSYLVLISRDQKNWIKQECNNEMIMDEYNPRQWCLDEG